MIPSGKKLPPSSALIKGKFRGGNLLTQKMKRRNFLITTLLSSGLIITEQCLTQSASIPQFSESPFTLGVASGDPQPGSGDYLD